MSFTHISRYLFPVSYGLLGVVALTLGIGYGLSEVAPVYVAVGIYAIALLGYVLPASASLINARENLGGVVAALILALVVTPAVLSIGGALTTARAALSVFEDFGDEFSTEFEEDTDTPPDLGGDPDFTEPQDYSGATTPDECEQIWFSDYSDGADQARDECVERVS